jgi:hypothetical protein
VSTPSSPGRRASLSAVTQGEYPYPPDEFDAVDRSDAPRGSHRRPRSTWSTLWPYGLALAVSGALAFTLVEYVWQDREPAPSAQGTGAPVTGAPTAPGATASPSPQGEPDLSAPVSVLNATSVRGLAGEVAAELEDAGWTAVVTGNYTGDDLTASTVIYGSPDLEASARAVAEELGIAEVELATGDATDGIDVVLEPDYAG